MLKLPRVLMTFLQVFCYFYWRQRVVCKDWWGQDQAWLSDPPPQASEEKVVESGLKFYWEQISVISLGRQIRQVCVCMWHVPGCSKSWK